MVPVKSCLQGACKYPGSLLEGEAILPAGIGRDVQEPAAVYEGLEHLQLRRLLPADKLQASTSLQFGLLVQASKNAAQGLLRSAAPAGLQ